MGHLRAGAQGLLIRYRNSFAPLIRLRLSDSPQGCAVDLTVQLEPLVAGFIGVWMSGVSFGFLVTLLSGSAIHALIPLGMVIFALTITGAGFSDAWSNVRRVVRPQDGAFAEPAILQPTVRS